MAAPATPPTHDTDDGSIRDGDMGRAILKGSAFGIPLVFVILFLIDMFAGLSVPLAAPHRRAPGTTEPSADRS